VTIAIRSVRDGDFEAIAALTNRAIVATSIHFGYDPVTAHELRDAWWPKRERFPYLVAEDDAGFVGYAKSGTWRERAAYGWTAETGIYVEERAQRRGIGTRLYVALVDACRAAGFHSLVAGITLPNRPSIALHESVGFRLAGTFRQCGWKFDAWHDVAFYELLLAGPDIPPGGSSAGGASIRR
jgi:phosphinothricin acetyltransferase